MLVVTHEVIPHHHDPTAMAGFQENFQSHHQDYTEAHHHRHDENHTHTRSDSSGDGHNHSFPFHQHVSAADDYDYLRIENEAKACKFKSVLVPVYATMLEILSPTFAANYCSVEDNYQALRSNPSTESNGLRAPPTGA